MGKRDSRYLVLLLAALLLTWVGCGGGNGGEADDGAVDDGAGDDGRVDEIPDVPPDEGGDPDAQDDGGEDEHVGTGSLTVTVMGLTYWTQELEPIAGADVALDLPGGGRTEDVTASDGTVTFEGIDWSAGTASVTAYKEGRGLGSYVGLTGCGDEELTLGLSGMDPGETVMVTATFENMTSVSNYSEVLGLDINTFAQHTGSSLRFTAPADMEFTVIAHEYGFTQLPDVRGFDQPFYAWIFADLGPYSADGTVTFDLASSPLESQTVQGSFPVPTRDGSVLASEHPTAYLWVMQRVEILPFDEILFTGFVGVPSHVEFSTDGRTVQYDAEWVTWPEAVAPGTRYNLDIAESWGGGFSSVFCQGYPTAGAQTFAFLDVPVLVVPADRFTPIPIHDQIEWEVFDAGTFPKLFIEYDSPAGYEYERWIVTGPEGATTLTVPDPPSTVNESEVLGDSQLQGWLTIVSDEPSGGCFWRVSSSGFLRFDPT
jgi:hypothetical protein